MNESELIEQIANALSVCSEMLNGRDQMVDALAGGEGLPTKSALTTLVDEAMQSWRLWKFGTLIAAPSKGTPAE